MISHVVVMFGLLHILYLVESVIIVQFCFWIRVDPYDQSRCCLASFSSWIAHCLFSLDSLISYSVKNKPLRSVMLLSCLVFVINHILSYRSGQFNSNFSVDRTCTISHIVVLFDLHHRPNIWSSSQTVPYKIRHDSLISFLALSGPVPLVTLLFCLVFVINCTLFDHFRQFSITYYVKHTSTISHSLSCLLLEIDHILSNHSWQFNSNVSVDRTCTISHNYSHHFFVIYRTLSNKI